MGDMAAGGWEAREGEVTGRQKTAAGGDRFLLEKALPGATETTGPSYYLSTLR